MSAPDATAPPLRSGHAPRAIARGAATAGTLALGTFLLYARVAGFEFIRFDDNRYVTQNPVVQRGLSWSGVRWAFTTLHSSNWHPLTWLSHMLDVQLFGLDAGAHHLVSAGLHACNAALLFLVLARMTGASGRSALVAALFAVHPLHVESVAWVAERKDVLSTFFGLLALGAWVRHGDRPRIATYVATVVCFALSLLAKPMWVTLPALLLLLDAWPLQRIAEVPAVDPEPPQRPRVAAGRILAEKAPLLVLSIASSAVTVVAQDRGGALAGLEFPLRYRVSNALVAYVQYLASTFWPSSLAVFYPHEGTVPAWQGAAAGALLLAVSTAVVLRMRRAPASALGWFWFLGTLVPVIGLVQVGAQSHADRYTYLPLVGIFIALAWGIERANRTAAPAAARAIAAFVVLALSAATWHQLGYWATNETLFQHALDVTSENALAHGALADGLRARGQGLEALRHAREAVRLDSGSARHWNNLAISDLDAELLPEARDAASRAVELNPAYAAGWSTLGRVEQARGDLEAAAGALAEAVRLAPDDAQAWFQLGVLQTSRRRALEAMEAYEVALRLAPDHFGAWTNLAVVYQQSGRIADATRAFEMAARIEPRNAVAWRNLGVLYAKLGRVAEAATAFETALTLQPDNVEVRRRLEMVRGDPWPSR